MASTSRLQDGRWAEGTGSVPLRIGAVTFGILALELALIRWSSGQVRAFAYFNNVVLIVAFLGMGLGVGLGRRLPGLVHFLLPVLLIVSLPLALADTLGLVHLAFPDPSIALWGGGFLINQTGVFVRNMAIFLLLLTAIGAVFVFAGGALGQLFGRIAVLQAYSADLLGSLLGVLAFTVLAWTDAGPLLWLALGVLPFVWLTRGFGAIVCAGAILALAGYSVRGAYYSPYNRIDLEHADGFHTLAVNRDFHQYLHDFSPARLNDAALPADFRKALTDVRDFYDLPFLVNAQRGSALVVGAGTGNDVQAALRQGYGKVTSVDIDRTILRLGRELHPEKPYSHPNVVAVNEDARAYFRQARGQQFDVVCFGLLDSHAMASAMSTLRLDNYVYTEEGIRSAWERVKPEGHLSLAMSSVSGEFFFRRLYWTIAKATGREPIAIYSPLHGWSVTYLVPGPKAKLDEGKLASLRRMGAAGTRETTLTSSDDWPFLYLRPGTVPWGYIVVLSYILIVAAWSARSVFGFGRGGQFDLPLFLMGAAFLLIETRGVTSMSLLFGSTWIVNSAVFAGILTMVLCANLAVARWQWRNPTPWFVALFLAALLLWWLPTDILNAMPALARGVVGGLLTGLPIGLAGVIVPMLLAASPNPTASLGANLVGAVVGGCLEYFSMFAGLRSVALMALVLYLLAFLLVRRRIVAAVPA